MISNSLFFSKLKSFHKQEIPFVAFRLPNSNQLSLRASKTESISPRFLNKKPGFVIMPFSLKKKGYLFPEEESFSTKIVSSNKGSLSKVPITKSNSLAAQKKRYLKAISDIISEISTTELAKLVYAESFDFVVNEDRFNEYFQRILNSNPNSFCYLFYHPKEGFWIGASPETLLTIEDKKITTMALAGTKNRGVSKWGAKEILEQKIVQNEILNDLAPYCKNLKAEKTHTSNAGNIDHLKTVLTGTTNFSPLEIVRAIHPTPAVAGVPKNIAISIIENKELQKRSFYSGYLGLINGFNCKLFVNLRCAQIKKNRAKVFVGGGITKDSVPEKEWEEIIEKSQTILRALYI